MKRDSKGRFSKLREDAEDFLDLVILAFKLLIIISIFYFVISYFELGQKLKSQIVTYLIGSSCEVKCKDSDKNGYF